MRTHFNRLTPQHFVLGEKRIRSFVEVLQRRVGEPSISVTCSDEATRRFENVEDLLRYENSNDRRIISLEFESIHSEPDPSSEKSPIVAIIGIRSSGMLTVVSGEDELATAVVREIEEIFIGGRPWYAWISEREEPFWWLLYALILPLPLVQLGHFSFTAPTFFQVISFVGYLNCLGLGSITIIRYLFPPAVFKIGQQRSRYNTREWVRRAIVGGILAALVISMLTALISFGVTLLT